MLLLDTLCAVAPRRRGPEAAASCGRDNPTHETGTYDPRASRTSARSSTKKKWPARPGGPHPRRALWGRHGCRCGRQGIPLTLHTQSPETDDVNEGAWGDARAGKGAPGAAITVSRTTLASCPLTKVPGAAPGEETSREAQRPPGTCPCKSLRNLPRQHLGRGAKIACRSTDLLLNKTAVTERPTRIASTRWTSSCEHLSLVSPRKKHTKMSPRRLIFCENVALGHGV